MADTECRAGELLSQIERVQDKKGALGLRATLAQSEIIYPARARGAGQHSMYAPGESGCINPVYTAAMGIR